MSEFSKDIGNNALFDSAAAVKIPKTKIVFGPDGQATDVASGAGFPVSVVSASGGFAPTISSDAISYASGLTTDVYSYYQGGSGGTLVATITVYYTDSTKAVPTWFIKT